MITKVKTALNLKTTHCVVCGAEATNFGGHVKALIPKMYSDVADTRDSEPNVIIAGCCDEHKDAKPLDSTGSFGEWKPAMGIAMFNSYLYD